MPYYPKHFIQTDLYTDGTEFQYKGTSTAYKGYYWKAGNGRYFAGKTPQQQTGYEIEPVEVVNNKTKNQLLDSPAYYPKARISIEGDSAGIDDNVNVNLVSDYIKLGEDKQVINHTRILPVNDPVLPTEEDYKIGEMRRYFCKKVNEIQYFEISKEYHSLLTRRNPDVVWDLYTPFDIPWTLTGNKETVEQVNRNITEYTSAKRRLPKFGDFLRFNYLKYYK